MENDDVRLSLTWLDILAMSGKSEEQIGHLKKPIMDFVRSYSWQFASYHISLFVSILLDTLARNGHSDEKN